MNATPRPSRRSTFGAAAAVLALAVGPVLTGAAAANPVDSVPTGFGHSAYRGVKLGMTSKDLRGTGAQVATFGSGTPCAGFVFKGGKLGGSSVDGYLQRKIGVVALWAKKDAVTAKGIRLGSSQRTFVAAYGQVKPDIHGFRQVKIGKTRFLAFSLVNRKVESMWVYDSRQQCFD